MEIKLEKSIVPVLGSGFNRWLLGTSYSSPTLTSWWTLLEYMMWTEDLYRSPNIQSTLQKRGTPTFAWEALLHAYKNANDGKDEGDLLESMATHIRTEANHVKNNTDIQARAQRFFKAIKGSRDTCEILSLNYDNLLGSIIEPKHIWQEVWSGRNAHTEKTTPANTTPVKSISLRTKYCSFDGGRIWFPHGSVKEPGKMVAGIHRYNRAATHVIEAYQHYKKIEREQMESKGHKPSLSQKYKIASEINQSSDVSWITVAIQSPLLLLGVGLSQEETDIWEFLHLRAREHRRFGKEAPTVWILSCAEAETASVGHWTSLSQGLNIQTLSLGQTWDDSWSILLKLLESDTTLF